MPRFTCSFCKGTGFIGSAKCRSCEGRGWYERPTSIVEPSYIIFPALLSVVFGIVGNVLHVWTSFFNGLAIACLGLSVVFLAMRLRGPEEKGWNGLMALGLLLNAIGILAVPVSAIWYLMTPVFGIALLGVIMIATGICFHLAMTEDERSQLREMRIRTRWAAAQRAQSNQPLSDREIDHTLIFVTYLFSPLGLIIAGGILILWSAGAKYFWGW